MKKILLLFSLIICFLSVNMYSFNADDNNVNVQIVIFTGGEYTIENISVSCPSGTYSEVFTAVNSVLDEYYSSYNYRILNEWNTEIYPYYGSTENSRCTVQITDYVVKENVQDNNNVLYKIYYLLIGLFVIVCYTNFVKPIVKNLNFYE